MLRSYQPLNMYNWRFITSSSRVFSMIAQYLVQRAGKRRTSRWQIQAEPGKQTSLSEQWKRSRRIYPPSTKCIFLRCINPDCSRTPNRLKWNLVADFAKYNKYLTGRRHPILTVIWTGLQFPTGGCWTGPSWMLENVHGPTQGHQHFHKSRIYEVFGCLQLNMNACYSNVN